MILVLIIKYEYCLVPYSNTGVSLTVVVSTSFSRLDRVQELCDVLSAYIDSAFCTTEYHG